MTPKIIHLCWFSNDPYPVEIKVCLESWQKVIPDYQIKTWTYDMASAIGIPFLDQALKAHKWSWAADVVRFYAVLTEGGVYMDSDIFLYKRFDQFVPEHGFATFNECVSAIEGELGLQAAFFMGEKGNRFCQDVVDFYRSQTFIDADGHQFDTISPVVMARIADKYGYNHTDSYQDLGELKIYPKYFLAPTKSFHRTDETFGQHRVYGAWRKRKLGRRIELWFHHIAHLVKYRLTH